MVELNARAALVHPTGLPLSTDVVVAAFENIVSVAELKALSPPGCSRADSEHQVRRIPLGRQLPHHGQAHEERRRTDADGGEHGAASQIGSSISAGRTRRSLAASVRLTGDTPKALTGGPSNVQWA